jgi:hypothetical protein
MTRSLVLFACLLAFAACTTPAAASWGPAEDLVASGATHAWLPQSVMTANGDVIASWIEDGGSGQRWQLGVWPQGASGVKQDLVQASGTDVALGTGGGAGVVAYATGDGDVHWRERPAGGVFGGEQTLSPPSGMRASNRVAVAMNVHGDLALVWGGAGVYAAVRPAGGAFSAPVALGSAFPNYLRAQLSDSGELVAAWVDSAGVRAGRRSPAGQASQDEALTSSPGQWAIDALAMDANGDAVLVWRQLDGPDTSGRMALRAPGGDFTESAFPGPGVYKTIRTAATITADGLVTLAYRTETGIAVYSGQFGATLRRLHTFNTGYFEVALATSRGGRTVIAFNTDFYHWVTAQRTGSGAFGAIEDLSPDCGYGSTPALGIDDDGRTSAAWGEYPSPSAFLARGDAGPGHQGCAPADSYSADDAGNPPPGGGPGGGRWAFFGPSPGPALTALRVGRPTMTGRGPARSIKLSAGCGERCSAFVSLAVVRPNGRVLQKWWTVIDDAPDGKLKLRTTIVLPPKLLLKLAKFGLDRPVEVAVRLSVADVWGRHAVRGVNVRGAPLPKVVGQASLTRCARARCRRTA